MSIALATDGLSKNFGGFNANSDISLTFPQGARYALIGPNGAGKTTFINLLTGVLTPTSGKVLMGDVDVTRLRQDERVKLGMTRTFQINTLFPGLTVLESVMLAILERRQAGAVWSQTVSQRDEEAREALDLLHALRLDRDADTRSRELAYGKQRLLEIALALAVRPKILLLDEPAAGIPAGQTNEVFSVIEELPEDVTILFVEHDMDVVFRYAKHIVVLVNGQVLTQGPPDRIASDQRVREVYLGEASHV